MADTTAIAIVSILAGTTAAVLGPAISARATRRQQRELFEHQRRMRDQDEAQRRFDAVAEAIEAAGSAVNGPYTMLQREGPLAEELAAAISFASQKIRELHFAIARLSLHIHFDAPSLEAARASADLLDEFCHRLDRAMATGKRPDGTWIQEAGELGEQAIKANQRFLREAQAEITR